MLGLARPAVQSDQTHDPKAVVIQRASNVLEGASLAEEQRDLLVPGFDGVVAGFPRDTNLLQQGNRADRAGVQAVQVTWHRSAPGEGSGSIAMMHPADVAKGVQAAVEMNDLSRDVRAASEIR